MRMKEVAKMVAGSMVIYVVMAACADGSARRGNERRGVWKRRGVGDDPRQFGQRREQRRCHRQRCVGFERHWGQPEPA